MATEQIESVNLVHQTTEIAHQASAIPDLVAAVSCLMLIAAGMLALSEKLKLPFTVFLVLIGIIITQLAQHIEWLSSITRFEITPELILFVFLPTLIFESAFNLDARQLKQNIIPVLTLAIPGLLLSTFLIGSVVWFLSTLFFTNPIPLSAALVLGGILSATDPVAVISLFKQLGAPKRLTVLVEGESLFNDATSIVTVKILVAVAIAGFYTFDTVLNGAIEFLINFFGGIFVGWIIARLVGTLLGLVESNPYIEISLTTILAYLSFLIAEHMLHVSGVMATVAAGVTMGGWGRTKISPSVSGFLDHFWEYIAYLANALIFLLVGLMVNLETLFAAVGLLFITIIAMTVARAAVIFGLVPVVGKLSQPISQPFQVVMFWGGLRGAIALAIVLHLPVEFAYKETFIAVVMGCVLFTLLGQGLTIETLVKKLGLNKPPLSDRLTRAEGFLSAKRCAKERIPELQAGGLFSARIAGQLTLHCQHGINKVNLLITQLRNQELNQEQEFRLLFQRTMTLEKKQYYEMFSKGHISESVYQDLSHSIDIQSDAIRDTGQVPQFTIHNTQRHHLQQYLLKQMSGIPYLSSLAEYFREQQIADSYEKAWGRHQGSAKVLSELDNIGHTESIRTEIIEDIKSYYQRWHTSTQKRIIVTTEQFPEFVAAMQVNLANRLFIQAQSDAIKSRQQVGIIPNTVADSMLEELITEQKQSKHHEIALLKLSPDEMLRKVPFFQHIPTADFDKIKALLKQRTYPVGEKVIQQGEMGNSLYLIARGVIRVSRTIEGLDENIATLMAGDFFGEMALLHHTPRNATCRAATPCALLELKRTDFEAICQLNPSIMDYIESKDKERLAQLANS